VWGGFFAAVEGTAMVTKHYSGTLSDTIRRWIGESSPHQTWWTWTRRGALIVFMGWLTGHFAFGLWG
jgi:hypothetical protein